MQFFEKVIMGNNVTKIGWSAFEDCHNLTDIKLPQGLKQIDRNAFANCYALSSISIPESVTSIGDGAFNYCTSLQSVKISDGITYINPSSFVGCISLSEIKLPKNLSKLGSYAFYYCPALQSLTIPGNVRTINPYQFRCKNLKTLTSLNPIPPDLIFDYESGYAYSRPFYGVDKSICKLYVPKGSATAYREAEGWKEFENIIEME